MTRSSPAATARAAAGGYTADVFAPSFTNAIACAFERRKMINGLTPQIKCFNFPCTGADCPFGVLPSDLEGPAPPKGTPNTFVMYWDSAVDGNAFVDGVRLWDFSVDWNSGAASFTSLGVIPGAA